MPSEALYKTETRDGQSEHLWPTTYWPVQVLWIVICIHANILYVYSGIMDARMVKNPNHTKVS